MTQKQVSDNNVAVPFQPITQRIDLAGWNYIYFAYD